MKNYVQKGDTVTLPAPYDRLAGQGAKIGALFGVAVNDVLSGADGEFLLTGVVDLPKVSAQAWSSIGTLIYWDNTDKVCTTTASTNLCIGVNVATAANPSATGRVRLNMGPQGIQGPAGE
jgi:predicted RecA/RadA family phage recombinase